MDFFGFGKSSNAADFHIDNAACAGLDGNRRGTCADDGLVEADGGAQFFLQASVVKNVIVPKRLFDHQQVELIEAAQVLHLIERVDGVCVAAQRDLSPTRAAFPHPISTPAGLDLNLYATITRRQFDLNFIQQLLNRILNADRDSARDYSPRAA